MPTIYGRHRGARPRRTLYDVISPYIGVTKGGPADLSERTGEKSLAAIVAQRNEAAERIVPAGIRNRRRDI